MAQNIEDILDDCLERLLKGESVEDCLRRYPQQASRLEPLLEISAVLQQKSAAIQPDPGFKARLHSRLEGMLRARKGKAERKLMVPVWRRGWAVAAACVLVVLFAGAGMVVASADALPGEPLYRVKLAGEQAKLFLAFSDEQEARLHIQFAERRAAEMAQIAQQGKASEIPVLAGQIAAHLGKVSEVKEQAGIATQERGVLAPRGGKGKEDARFRNRVAVSRARALGLLRAALVETPAEVRPLLEEAIDEVARDYDEVLLNLDG